MLVHPNIDPVAIHLGPLAVHWYGLMYLLGFWGGWWLLLKRGQSKHMPMGREAVNDLVFYVVMGVILGGRIGYVLFYGLSFWAKDVLYPFKIWDGGMSFHGGMLGVIVACALFAWRRRRNIADVLDFTVPLPGLGLFFGRIGNFINSELWGKVTTVPWGFNVNGQVRHPSQLYEAFFEGLVLEQDSENGVPLYFLRTGS